MSTNNGIIRRSINIRSDVKRVLKTNSNNIGALCQDHNINIYSKSKPYIVRNKFNPIDDSDRKAVNYGMEIKNIQLTTGGIYAVPPWGQWRPPKGKYVNEVGGTVIEPCRIGDFDGYDHNAQPFIKSVMVQTSHVDGKTLICSASRYGAVSVVVETNWSNDRTNLTFADFKHSNGTLFSECYLCAALFPLAGANYNEDVAIYAFSEEKLGDHVGNFRLSLETAPNSKFLEYVQNSINDNTCTFLIIGIVPRKDPLPSPTEFISPVIFPAFANMPWVTKYNSFATFDGNYSYTDYYFKAGMRSPSVELEYNQYGYGGQATFPALNIKINEVIIGAQQINAEGHDITNQSIRIKFNAKGTLSYENGITKEFLSSSESYDISNGSLSLENILLSEIELNWYGIINVAIELEIIADDDRINTTNGTGTRWKMMGDLNSQYVSKRTLTQTIYVRDPFA